MTENGKRKFNNAGFTLVEMIVVLVLITILLGVASIGIIAFQDQARRMKLDDAAENIFSSAQARLTRMYTSGDLKHWQKLLKDADGNYTVEAVPVINMASSFVPDSNYITRSLMPSESEEGRVMNTMAMLQDSASIWGDYSEDNVLISLKAKAGDYDRYLTSPGSLPNDTLFLFALLTENITDPEILNAAICLEVAPEDAQVFSAFYSLDAESFDYLGKTEGASGVVDISRREYTSREDKELGYFGVETLTHVSVKPPQDLKLGTLKLYNEDTFNGHLSFDGEVEESAPKYLNYTLTLYDELTKKKVLVFRFSGNDVQNRDADIVANYVTCETYRYGFSQEETALGSCTLPVFWEKRTGDEKVPGLSFVLDAADASAATSILDGNNKEAEMIRAGQMTGAFAETLSFFRFGTWTENSLGSWTDRVYAEINAVDDGDEMSGLEEEAFAVSDPECPFFADMEFVSSQADAKVKEFGKNAEILNARHLYNIRYFEDFELGNLGDKNITNYNHYRFTFRLTQDIDWAEFAKTSYYATSDKAVHVERDGNHKVNAEEFGFPSIRQLRSHNLGNNKMSYDKLTGKKEGSTPEGTDNLKLAFAVSGLEISHLDNEVVNTYVDYKEGQKEPTGLFLENQGTIEYFAVDQSHIIGNYKVGAICGVNRGILQFCGTRSTRNDKHPDPTIVEGYEDVGGVFGYNACTKNPDAKANLYYRDLTNNARVLGRKYVGGITGRLVNGSSVCLDDSGTSADYGSIDMIGFTRCENYGQVRGESTEGMDPADTCFIGGIVGYISNTQKPLDAACALTNCYSHPIYDKKYDEEYPAIEQLLTIRHAELDENSDVMKALNRLNVGYYVGGIAGFAYDITIKYCGSPLRNNKYTDGYGNELEQNAFLFGDRYVGGIVGFTASRFEDNKVSTNCMTVCGNDYVGGIAGITAAADLEQTADGVYSVSVIEERVDNTKINVNFAVNRGCVFAKHDYAGGLAGISYGTMKSNRVEAYGDMSVKVSGRNFVGGITGRHCGGSTADGSNVTVSCSVDGENYVGGMIAYVGSGDVKPYKKNTDVRCSVYGNGSFAGGVFGAVTDSAMADQTDYRYLSKPMALDGRFYVGGAVGAVMLHADGAEHLLMIPVDASELELHATAFAGGLSGYTVLVGAESEEELRSRLDAVGGVSYTELHAADITLQKGIDRHREQNAGIGESLSGSLYVTTSKDTYICKVKSISPLDDKGLVYAGGVVGINGEISRLNFKQMNYASNKWKTNYKVSMISATHIMDVYEVYDTDQLHFVNKEIACAYAGPLIGLNNKNSTIEDSLVVECKMSSEAYYRGGMCEINQGDIKWFNMVSDNMRTGYISDDEAVDHVGTMCGKNEGKIYLNHSPRFIVKGRHVVGGLVGENYNTIVLQTKGTGDTLALLKQVDVEASESVAGGVVGRNMGNIVCPYAPQKESIILEYGVKVKAKDAAGGFIGEQYVDETHDNEVTIEYFGIDERANGRSPSIEATEGAAGGIIGRLVDLGQGILIQNCSYIPNANGTITFGTVVKGRYAGGLIGEVSMQAQYISEKTTRIRECTVFGQQIADGTDAMAGGIIGRIDVKTTMAGSAAGNVQILDCIAMSKPKNNNSKDRTAGIIYDAAGRAVIDNCRCYSPTDAAYGICGTDAFSITNCLANDRQGQFGSCVEMEDKSNFRNNYCITTHESREPQGYADTIPDVTAPDVYFLAEYNPANQPYHYYGIYKDENGVQQKYKTDLVIRYTGTKPAWASTDQYRSLYKGVDADFESYINAHGYSNPYRN